MSVKTENWFELATMRHRNIYHRTLELLPRRWANNVRCNTRLKVMNKFQQSKSAWRFVEFRSPWLDGFLGLQSRLRSSADRRLPMWRCRPQIQETEACNVSSFEFLLWGVWNNFSGVQYNIESFRRLTLDKMIYTETLARTKSKWIHQEWQNLELR